MRKIISTLLVIVFVFAMVPGVFAVEFSDVANNKWYSAPISYCKDQGLVSGYSDGTFKPNNNITRAEFCVMLNKVSERLNLKKKSITDAASCKQYEKQYSDYRSNKWYSMPVANCLANGYISGTSKNMLSLNRNILRQDVAVMADKMFGWTFEPNTHQGGLCKDEAYKDSKGEFQLRYWYYPMYRFIDIGIYQGEKDWSTAIKKYGSVYKNDQPITRAEMCTVFKFILENQNWIDARENKYDKLDPYGVYYYLDRADGDAFFKWQEENAKRFSDDLEMFDAVSEKVTIDTVTIKAINMEKAYTFNRENEIFPDSSIKRLKYADVEGMSIEQLERALNEIYRRHGQDVLKEIEESGGDARSIRTWQSDKNLSRIEKYNESFLKNLLKEN